MTHKLTLCLDFDGVLHSYSGGWKGADVILDPPVFGAMAFLKEATKHFHVVILSSRSHQSGGILAMRKWVEEWAHIQEPEDYGWIASLEYPTTKPAAFVTIDDRAVCFTGVWPSMDELKSFRPWNRKMTDMAQYRKKPVVIEAWRLPMSDDASRAFDGNPNIIFKREGGVIVEAVISTLEGVMTAADGDWIIRGVQGELYPCKPDIFAATYEPA